MESRLGYPFGVQLYYGNYFISYLYLTNIIAHILMKPHVPEPPLKENLKLKEKSEVITSITHASQRSRKIGQMPVISCLNLDNFKNKQCHNSNPHLFAQCPYFHTAKDHRRSGNFYSSTACPYTSKDENCPYGQSCPNSHTKIEQLYNTQTYKKKYCEHYPSTLDKCEYGNYCPYAHSQQQIKIQLIHNFQYDEDFFLFLYKTVFCPYELIEHDREKCVYAHGSKDFRRSVVYYPYAAMQCYERNQSGACEKGYQCGMCHGELQLNYHPNAFRTRVCEQNYCQDSYCPHYHCLDEKRTVEEQTLSGIFYYVPKNRITKNIFKYCNQQEHFLPRSTHEAPKSKSTLSTKQYQSQTKNGYVCKTQIETHKAKEQKESPKPNRHWLGKDQVQSDVEGESD